ncbi:hypothetical protein JOD29_000498 [Lysinibacillus composti]|uniref:Uncharacterized protein n=1 Tax=Lysinibacillus composti TaxID=720633 RepID=A0A3N9UUP9_9BACI|nr:hypothetical protein [Lysinibacillus composti]MBM7607261.1 hypothetical protein [Lysinibacillus composti]RQW76162.1 hypothetical protein EBB45_01025 [Lysinibacillus composti]
MKRRHFYLDMTSTQIGEGDRYTLARIMTRLTMAKVLEGMGHNVDDLTFFKSCQNYDYYSHDYSDTLEDLIEFLELADAPFEWDSADRILKLNFPKEVHAYSYLAYAIEYGWGEMEMEILEDEDGNEIEIVEVTDEGLVFRLESYNGIPIEFMKAYAEMVKEKNL